MVFGDGYSIMPFNQYKWRLILPISQSIMAIILLAIGQHEYHAVSSHQNLTSIGGEWTPEQHDVLAPTTQLAYAINFPALLVVRLVEMFTQDIFVARAVFFLSLLAV